MSEPTPTIHAAFIREHLNEHLLGSEVLPLFNTGRIVITNGLQDRFGEQTLDLVAELLTAHSCCYWGNALPAGDWQSNDDPGNIERFERLPSEHGKDYEPRALHIPGRVLASWRFPKESESVWVITESGDNGFVTTVLLPSAY